MTYDEIEQWVALAGSSRIQTFELEEVGQRLKVTFGTRAPMAKVAPLHEPAPIAPVVKSPGMGIVRLTHPQQSTPFVAPGSPIKKGQILAFLEYRGVLEHIVSERDGTLADAKVKDGDLVGYADVVFELK
ncbi:hypothetical protein GIR22_09175 [Pseudomonas sp. CCM 7891]|uniref:Lipoyl-binding domain-containing protein n=1 Tax=Pseudomonas karstica TaxID=1055468 RepID=A0A7X2UX12_9PSED|nr:biotin/lipoyl-containing protein [Pseudomonas karstica]MTD19316.1 hypothetical protein [Pseudomonas karstica]